MATWLEQAVERFGPPRIALPDPVIRAGLIDIEDARQILRVLAALDLIPAELAEVRDERYARCITCDRTVAFDPGLWPPRWVHLDQRAWAVVPHRAEVAE